MDTGREVNEVTTDFKTKTSSESNTETKTNCNFMGPVPPPLRQ